MSAYRRFFRVVGGPVIDAIKEARKINNDAHAEYAKICEEIGAKPGYYHRDRRLVGFDFEGRPDSGLFKSVRAGWYPKKNCKAGKELAARIEAVETKNVQDALQLVGLSSMPTIFHEGRCYFPTLTIIPEDEPVAYIAVPWLDEDPEKIEQYKKDRKSGDHMDSTLDALLWHPTAEMVEVKRWEVDRHISEWNEKIKAA